jgi:type IV secretion system protein VirB8
MSKEQVIETSKMFEEILMTKDKKANKFALIVAVIMALIAVISVAAIIVLLPLKQTDVELYTVDRQTGRVELVSRVNSVDISTQEAMAKAFAANYVHLREGYNYFSLQSDYNSIQLFNSPDVNKEYLDLFTSRDAPDKVYKNAENVVSTEIISNQISPATEPDSLATIRVKRTIRHIIDGATRTEIWDVRLTFRYIPQKDLTDKQREINPLGFIVTSYQHDKELRQE